jgi:hypothetical protein
MSRSKAAGVTKVFMKRRFPISSLTILIFWILVSFFPNPGFPQRAKDSAPNSAPVSVVLPNIIVDFQPQGVKVELRGDNLSRDFHNFTLSRPPRLVIDFPGVLTSFPNKFLSLNHPLLKEVRFGQHPGKLRLVLTFPKKELPLHRIVEAAGGLSIIVGKIDKVPEEGKKPEAEKPSAKIYPREKITLDFVEVDIRKVFALISETAQQQIVPSSDVQGTITLRMIDVPWQQALDAILSIYGLIRVDEGSLIRIFPKERSSQPN